MNGEGSSERLFWHQLNQAMGYLAPPERKAINEIRQACSDYGLAVTDALEIAQDCPECVPEEIDCALRRADEMDVFAKIAALFSPGN